MVQPLISVVIPTYNYEKYIVEAIDSVLNQDYPIDKIEIIVIDDGSMDNTSKVLENLIRDKTIKYFYQKNAGKASATYKAIQISSGKYIFNLDADDLFFRNRISKVVQKFEEDEKIIHIGSPAKKLTDLTKKMEEYEVIPLDLVVREGVNGIWLLKRFLNDNFLLGGGSTYAARASILKRINIPVGVDMYIDEFLVFAILPFGNSYFINEALTIWRDHSSNYSSSGKNKEYDIEKNNRFLTSSAIILNYLQDNIDLFGDEVVNIYKLKDAVRRIGYKHFSRSKNIVDIKNYLLEIFSNPQINWRLIKNYRIIYGIIPSTLYNLLYKIKH